MIKPLTLQQVAPLLNGTLHFGDCQFERVSTDTRNLQAGDLFVALRGENFDAHDFLAEAARKQACALVVEQVDSGIALPQLQVADTTVALGQLGRANRDNFTGPVIAITGSGGKTTVKTMLASILGKCGAVYATRGNLNNHIGLPLSLLEISADTDYAVLELGASAAGEIAYLAALAKPHVGLVNNALRAHVAGFGSVEGVAKAKGEMFEGLADEGVAILNLDDPAVELWRNQIGARKCIGFSVKDHADAVLRADKISESASGAVSFVLHTPAGESHIQLSQLGRHNVANAVAAAACAYALGISLDDIKAGLEVSRPVAGRMEVKSGIKGATIIDDSYNANPDSVRAALDALSKQPGEKTLVLGDMGELGPEAANLHRELGELAKDSGLDCLVTVGELTKNSHQAFGSAGRHFENYEDAVAFIETFIGANSVVLVKGSRSARMERVVAALTRAGEN